jgi:hypothetical protein
MATVKFIIDAVDVEEVSTLLEEVGIFYSTEV